MMIMMTTWFDETICMYMLWLHLYVYDMLKIIVQSLFKYKTNTKTNMQEKTNKTSSSEGGNLAVAPPYQ